MTPFEERQHSEFKSEMERIFNMTPTENKTLRDEFAMAALTGLLASEAFIEKINEQAGGNDQRRRAILVYQTYVFADAMLEARKK